ncbi:hypothetical protein [Clostridium perfringens]|uniref:hypothetical protein n=1 Tax=Clostridium perfringens TaxID=1502 RepID=UPI000F538382|nr:hypothetical protein [Clostridium perfringens]EJT6340608.1 hypothetical protein [Clostridium perfringens]MBI6019861.1 hypothetical protein [Clostridium perfringens]
MSKKDSVLKGLTCLSYFVITYNAFNLKISEDVIITGINPVLWILCVILLTIKLVLTLIKPFLKEEIKY